MMNKDTTITYSNSKFSYYITINDTTFEFATSEELRAAIVMIKRVARLFDGDTKVKTTVKSVIISDKKLTVKINMFNLI